MNLVELFAGTRSIGKAADILGWDSWSTDLYAFEGMDAVTDILTLDPADVPFVPDFIWASPPCTAFTVMMIGKNWHHDHAPKTPAAELGMRIVEATWNFIDYWSERNPNLLWAIENPRGKLRKLPMMARAPYRKTVTYCQYGDTRMKPTDIWSNFDWPARPICKNGDPCHVSAPRGSKTAGSTQGHASVDRSRIPEQLCREMMETVSELVYDLKGNSSLFCAECGDEAVTETDGGPLCLECDGPERASGTITYDMPGGTMRTPISELRPGPLDQKFLIGSIERAKTKAGKTYLRISLRDATGSVAAVDWEPTAPRLALAAGNIIRVVGSYAVDPKYGPQVSVRKTSAALDLSEEEKAAFAESCPNSIELVRGRFDELLAHTLPHNLVEALADALAPGGRFEDFWTAPAATIMHQGYREGLFEHSVQVASIANRACEEWCREADQNVLTVAGLLHDIGKIVEYSDPLTRTLTTTGKLFGNTTLSHQMVFDFIEPIEMDVVAKANILHCILSHHGRKEWGSPVLPQTIEANIIHLADQMSSKIGGFQRLLRETEEGREWSAFDRMFDSALWLGGSMVVKPEGEA